MERVADAIYALVRKPRSSDRGLCDNCGDEVLPHAGYRDWQGMFCSEQCSYDFWGKSVW